MLNALQQNEANKLKANDFGIGGRKLLKNAKLQLQKKLVAEYKKTWCWWCTTMARQINNNDTG